MSRLLIRDLIFQVRFLPGGEINNMKNFYRKGFTLIELLIVIVIIGVLATAVLSAINPIEQIRKAEDSGRRSDSAELLNAIERYYTSFKMYPWQSASGTTIATWGNVPTLPGSTSGLQLSAGTLWLTSGLIRTSELKAEFTGRSNLTDMRVFWQSGTNDLVRICFAPTSESYRAQAGWNPNGSALATCTSAGCFECVPE